LNSEEVEPTYIVQDGEEMCKFYLFIETGWRQMFRFHLLSETVLLRQIWDCPIHDGEEMCRFHLLLETVLLRQIWNCPIQDGEERCRFHLLLETVLLGQIWDCPIQDGPKWRTKHGFKCQPENRQT
jgi:hypothetical protein